MTSGPKTSSFTAGRQRPAPARLIDWDHVGVGLFSFDLSTFLYRSAAEERLWLLDRYRAAAERAGRRLPGTEELNLLFHAAESARFAHSILFDAMAVLNDGAEWRSSASWITRGGSKRSGHR